MPLTEALVERAAAGLAEGGWQYTPRQLYYAACAEAEIPPNNAAANGELTTGALLALVALILIHFTVVFAALLALAIVLLGLGVIARVSRREPAGRVLAASYESFARDFGGVARPGLIGTVDAGEPPATADAVLVCDTDENAQSVVANLARAGLDGVSVVSIARMPAQPPQAVAALHDASPRGCATVLELRDAGIDVVDAGLHPAGVDNVETQVLEGAPARLPRDLRPLLDDEEIAWLMSGRRVELATRTPQQVMTLVRDALKRLERTPAGARGGA